MQRTKNAGFVLDRAVLRREYKKISGLADYVAYSFKTNPLVGKVLQSESRCYFNVSSWQHINKIMDKSRIIFSAQAWNERDIKNLLSRGINKFIVDNKRDLDILTGVLEKCGKKGYEEKRQRIWLLLRMKLKEHTLNTGKYFVFGMDAEKINDEILRLQQNRNIEKSIERLGVHVHRKSQNISEWSLKREFLDSLKKETLKAISIIDVGGGFPVDYKNSRANINEIFGKIRELKNWLNARGIAMMVEPGRFLAAPAIKLKAYVKSISERNIIVNCSVYNAAPDTFITNTRLIVEDETDERHGEAYTIKGCTPDAIDIFRYRVYLKKKPRIGEEIVFLNAGAYNFSTDFDGLKKLNTEII